MENTILIELEELKIIKVLKNNTLPEKIKLSDKYRGIISNNMGDILN